LEALTDFYKSDSDNSDTYQTLTLLPVLYEKKLWYPFEQRLKKTQEKAKAAESWINLYELLEWEKKYLKKSNNRKEYAEKLTNIYQQQTLCTQALQQETQWQNFYLQLNSVLINDNRLRLSANRQRFEELGKISESDKTKFLSLKALFYYHRGRNVYYRHVGQPEKALKHAQCILNILEAKQDSSQLYVDALCSLSRVYDILERFDLQEEIMQKLMTLPQYNDENIITVFDKTCHIGMRYYLNTHQFEQAAILVETLNHRWEQLRAEIQPFRQQFYCYHAIITHWILADYSKTMTWVAMILDYKYTQEGKNFLLGARLLELMIYYEYRPEVLDSRLDSIRRVLDRHWELGDYEKQVFAFFGKLIRQPEREHSSIFQNFYTTLKKYAEQRLIASNEMMYWCQSKIEKKTLRAIIEQAN